MAIAIVGLQSVAVRSLRSTWEVLLHLNIASYLYLHCYGTLVTEIFILLPYSF